MCRLAGCKGNVSTWYDPKSRFQAINAYSEETSRMIIVRGMVYQVCDVCSGSNPEQTSREAISKYLLANPDTKGSIDFSEIALAMGVERLMDTILPDKESIKQSKLKEKPTLPAKTSKTDPAKLPPSLEKRKSGIVEDGFVHSIEGGGGGNG